MKPRIPAGTAAIREEDCSDIETPGKVTARASARKVNAQDDKRRSLCTSTELKKTIQQTEQAVHCVARIARTQPFFCMETEKLRP